MPIGRGRRGSRENAPRKSPGNPAAQGELEIHAQWKYPGYVARVPGRAEFSVPCSGPRQAAHALASRLFGHPHFKLTRQTRVVYLAVERER